MKKTNPSYTRVRTGPQSLKHKKSNPNVPAELSVFLYLPGVGSVADYEWFAPLPDAEPLPLRTSLRGALGGGSL
jgi:hypothetical protein